MNREAIVFDAVDILNKLSGIDCKWLYTTSGFRLLGIITSDRNLDDEGTGLKRRWIKGLRLDMDEDVPLEDRLFETSLHRKNPKSGMLEPIVVHEDSHMILMERKTFDLNDEAENFQSMPNLKALNRVKEIIDKSHALDRTLQALDSQMIQAKVDVNFYSNEATLAREEAETHKADVQRLQRDNIQYKRNYSQLEALYNDIRAKLGEYTAYQDEMLANASERGTEKAMTAKDRIVQDLQDRKDIEIAHQEITTPSTDMPALKEIKAKLDELAQDYKELKLQASEPVETSKKV